MLNKIIKNSAAAVKIKAKLCSSLNDIDYENMIKCGSVPKIAEYLKQNSGYKNIFSGIDITNLHRGEMEEMIKLNTKQDMKSLLPYLDMDTRSFLKIYDIHDEVEGIKFCARKMYSKTETHFNERYIRKYLMIDGTVDFLLLLEAKNFDEFMAIIEKSDYKEMFLSLKSDVSRQTLFNIETILDFYYIRTIIKYINKYSKGKENKSLRMLFGTEIDLLNISSIIRAKRYYKMSNEEIYPILFMDGYRLKKEDITKMVETETASLAVSEIKNAAYRNIFSGDEFFEKNIDFYIFNMHRRQLRSEPYSNASVVSYLYLKKFELKNIITVIEGVRYGINAEDIKKYIIAVQ